MKRKHRLQERACKLILGINYTDFEKALKNLNLIKFEDRVTFNQAIPMFKIANDESPNYLRDMFKMKVHFIMYCNCIMFYVYNQISVDNFFSRNRIKRRF